jgi:hypothetical protein
LVTQTVGRNARSIVEIESDGESEGKMEKKISTLPAIPQMEMITTQLNEKTSPMSTLEKKNRCKGSHLLKTK